MGANSDCARVHVGAGHWLRLLVDMAEEIIAPACGTQSISSTDPNIRFLQALLPRCRRLTKLDSGAWAI